MIPKEENMITYPFYKTGAYQCASFAEANMLALSLLTLRGSSITVDEKLDAMTPFHTLKRYTMTDFGIKSI